MLTETNGEQRAVTGFDPRLVRVLGGNLYTGDLGVIAMRECIQNSIDTLREATWPGKVEVTYDTNKRSLIVTDNGMGMTPELMTKELVDIGGSSKPNGSSGGFGIAKVAIFSNAKEINVSSTAKVGNKFIKTTLSGSGEDWIDTTKGLKVCSEVAWSPSGTCIKILFDDTTKLSQYEANRFITNFSRIQQLNVEFIFKLDGELLQVSTVNLRLLTSLDAKPFNIELYIDNTVRAVGYKTVNILNIGLPQFDESVFLNSSDVKLPSIIVANVIPKVTPESDQYPFTPDRQRLKSEAKDMLDRYITRTMATEAIAHENEKLRNSLRDAICIGKTKYKLVDTTATIDKNIIDALNTPHLEKLSLLLDNLHTKLIKALMEFEVPDTSCFFGVGICHEFLGINLLGQPLLHNKNLILINPYSIAKNANSQFHDDEQAAHYFIGTLVATLLHEIVHEHCRSHNEMFSTKLTMVLPQAIKYFSAAMRRECIPIYKDFLSDFSRFHDVLGQGNIFDKVGVS